MNRRGLRIAVSLFVVSLVLFCVLLISMNFIIIEEEFNIVGKVEALEEGFELTFYEFEDSFYGYDIHDVMEITPIGSSIAYDGIVLNREIKREIRLKEGMIYEYIVEIKVEDTLNINKIGTNFRIPSKQQRTMIDLLLSEIIR